MGNDAHVLIGGRTVESPMHPVYNPAHAGQVVGRSALADTALVDRAVAAAADAAPGWAALTVTERRDALKGAAGAALADFEDRARLLTGEQGKVLWESMVDLAGAPYLLRECRRLIERVAEEQIVDDERGRFVRRRRPVGVVAVIVPWNYPVLLAFNSIAPALAAGNTVVVKPSELAPLTLTAVLRSVAAALPDGVINVVPGDGAQTGHALAAHPRVRRVMFTGGTASGREVMRAVADTITGVGLELGGNDPALVLESAVVDDALVTALRNAVFTCSGQVCFAIKRIYVHRSHFRELVDALAAVTDQLAVGDGLDPASSIGPLISAAARDRVQELIRDSAEIGGTVTELGRKVDPDGWADGHFVRPHLVTGIPQQSRLVAAEQFGPVLPILAFDTEAEAVALANDSEYGLAASVWSRDDGHAFEVARGIEAGTVFVNVHAPGASDHTTPFGGVKQSGIGRINGWASIEELTETQMLIRRDDAANLPGPPS